MDFRKQQNIQEVPKLRLSEVKVGCSKHLGGDASFSMDFLVNSVSSCILSLTMIGRCVWAIPSCCRTHKNHLFIQKSHWITGLYTIFANNMQANI